MTREGWRDEIKALTGRMEGRGGGGRERELDWERGKEEIKEGSRGGSTIVKPILNKIRSMNCINYPGIALVGPGLQAPMGEGGRI